MRIKRILVAAVALLAVAGIRTCGRDDVRPPAAVLTERAATLAETPGAVAAVVVERGRVAVASKRPDGMAKAESRYVPPEGRAEVVVKKDGAVSLRVKDKGFCFSPGLYGGGSFGARGLRPAFGLGAKLVFWGRFGLDAGVVGPAPVGFAGISYIPDWRLRNTSVWVGASTAQQIVGGFAVRF